MIGKMHKRAVGATNCGTLPDSKNRGKQRPFKAKTSSKREKRKRECESGAQVHRNTQHTEAQTAMSGVFGNTMLLQVFDWAVHVTNSADAALRYK